MLALALSCSVHALCVCYVRCVLCQPVHGEHIRSVRQWLGKPGAGRTEQRCLRRLLGNRGRGGKNRGVQAAQLREHVLLFKNREIKTSNQRAPNLTSASAVALPLCFFDEKEDGKEVLCRSCAMRMMGGCASAGAAAVAAAASLGEGQKDQKRPYRRQGRPGAGQKQRRRPRRRLERPGAGRKERRCPHRRLGSLGEGQKDRKRPRRRLGEPGAGFREKRWRPR